MASKEAFAVTCVELYGRLWTELEALIASEEYDPGDSAQPAAGERLQILKLEIHLLICACNTARWQWLLSASQRLALKSILQDVWLAVDTETQQSSAYVIALAQNRLFDAVREHGALSASHPAMEDLRTARA
jgi:hypothetical protein